MQSKRKIQLLTLCLVLLVTQKKEVLADGLRIDRHMTKLGSHSKICVRKYTRYSSSKRNIILLPTHSFLSEIWLLNNRVQNKLMLLLCLDGEYIKFRYKTHERGFTFEPERNGGEIVATYHPLHNEISLNEIFRNEKRTVASTYLVIDKLENSQKYVNSDRPIIMKGLGLTLLLCNRKFFTAYCVMHHRQDPLR